jgi:hypothetical protein
VIIKFILVANRDRLQLKLLQADLVLEMPNLHAFDRIKGIPVGFGITEEQIANPPPKAKIEEIGFTPLFTYDMSADLVELEQLFFEYHTALTHEKIRGKYLSDLTFFLVDRYDYELWVEDFEEWPEDRKLALEYMLLLNCKGHKLSINGKAVEIPAWKRRVEKWIRFLLTGIIPYGIMISSLFSLQRSHFTAEGYWHMAAIILLGLCVDLAGQAVWMVSMRKFVPKSYLRNFLPGLDFQFITNKLAKRFLAD